jgi:TonB family protein
MPTAGIYSDNSSSNFDRRSQIRQRLNELAYVDIGADNGGIILNMSVEGMGIQAAVPLSCDPKVNLRLQLPQSGTRIEIAAEIVWVGPGNQEAGLRFLDAPSAACAQIRDWMNAQPSAKLPSCGSAPQVIPIASHIRKENPVVTTRKDKWLSLMGELEAQKALLENQLSIDSTKKPAPSISNYPVKPQAPTTLQDESNFPGEKEFLTDGTQPLDGGAKKVRSRLDSLLLQARAGSQRKRKSAEDSAAMSVSYDDQVLKELLDWPIRSAKKVPDSLPENPQPSAPQLTESLNPPASTAGAIETDAVNPGSALPHPPALTKSRHVAGWGAIGILLASICALSYGFGKWVGRPGIRPASTKVPEGQAVELQVAAAPTTRATPRHSEERAKEKRVRSVNAAPTIPPKDTQRRITLATNPSSTISALPSNPSEASPNPLMPSTPPENRPSSTPAMQAPGRSIQAPKVIAGRQLKLTDRYITSHLSYRVEPTYPAEAIQQRIEGAVKIHLVIGADGSVESVKLLSGPPLLAPAALDAAKYWRYLPSLLNGQPVESEQDIEIDFRLPR